MNDLEQRVAELERRVATLTGPVTWRAMDPDGCWYDYPHKPTARTDGWAMDEDECCEEVEMNWRDSLIPVVPFGWIAMDCNGCWFFYTVEPKIASEKWQVFGSSDYCRVQPNDIWRYTLHEC